MNLAEAFQLLKSSSPRERLRAARFLAENAENRHVPFIKARLGVEGVSWVRRALQTALDRAENRPKPTPVEVSFDTKVPDLARLRSLITEEITAMMLHEIEPILGLIRVSAVDDCPRYEGSRLKEHIDRLGRVIAAIRDLRRASHAIDPVEFDVAEFVQTTASQEELFGRARVSFAGPKPMLAKGDPRLLALAISNGFRNAVEAAIAAGDRQITPEIILTWGRTPIENWISILDNGGGPPPGIGTLFQAGISGKTGHSGMGLYIAQQALSSHDGQVTLSPAMDGGAIFEVRWFRGEAT